MKIVTYTVVKKNTKADTNRRKWMKRKVKKQIQGKLRVRHYTLDGVQTLNFNYLV